MTAYTPQPMPQPPVPPVGYLPPQRAAWLRYWLAAANVTDAALRGDLIGFAEELHAEATVEAYHRGFLDGEEETRARTVAAVLHERPPQGPPPLTPPPQPPGMIQFESTWAPPPEQGGAHRQREGIR
jgi:hypothetical protein